MVIRLAGGLAASAWIIVAGWACSVAPSAHPSPTVQPQTTLFSAIATPAPSLTATADCSPDNLQAGAQLLNQHLARFDEYAALASSVARSQIAIVIPPMRAIRADVDAQHVPPCLTELKRLELLYMDTAIKTLLSFEAPTPDAAALAAGIVQGRQYHDQYSQELARLFGLTLPTPAALPAWATPSP